MVYLVSEDAPTGMIITAGAGVFAAAQIVETDGVNLGHKATADDVAAYIGKIADWSTAKHYNQGGEQSAKFFARRPGQAAGRLAAPKQSPQEGAGPRGGPRLYLFIEAQAGFGDAVALQSAHGQDAIAERQTVADLGRLVETLREKLRDRLFDIHAGKGRYRTSPRARAAACRRGLSNSTSLSSMPAASASGANRPSSRATRRAGARK